MNNVHLKRSLGFIDSVCGCGASASLLGQLGLFVREKTAHHEGRHIVLRSDSEFYKVASSLSTPLKMECLPRKRFFLLWQIAFVMVISMELGLY